MSRKQQLSEEHPSDEVGILLTNPRSYRRLRALLLLRRSRTLYRKVAALAGASDGDDAVDIGCGPGELVIALTDRVGAGGSVIGVDPAREMVEYARAHGRPNSRFEIGAAQDVALPDESADVITSTFVMHHIPQARRDDALANIYRILRPGGTALIADAHPGGPIVPTLIRAMSRYAARHTHDDAVSTHSDPVDAIDIRRYRPDLERLGFNSIEFHIIGSTTGVLIARKPAQ